MERIFKIKTKTDRAPQSHYPSERRYSASIVIGLSVVFIQLFFYSILMGTLIVHKMTVHTSANTTTNQTDTDPQRQLITDTTNVSSEYIDPYIQNMSIEIMKLYDKIDKDINIILQRNSQTYINLPSLMCSGCYLMAVGYFSAFATGVLAWKQWYIDHNITLFFVASSFSTLTAVIGLLLSLITCINQDFNYDTYIYEASKSSPITFALAMNITILATVGSIWSCLSTKVAYAGMKSSYPDDIILGKGGRHIEVSTVKRGSKKDIIFPPDIIEHIPPGNKLAKYLPKKEHRDLPKAESTLEYRQRVDKFLSEVPETTGNKSA